MVKTNREKHQEKIVDKGVKEMVKRMTSNKFPKHHKCECCGAKVFWRYQDGKKLLLDEYDPNKELFPPNHYCFWED